MFRLAGSLVIVLILVGCTASTIAMRPESADVQIGNTPPGNGFTLLGAISAKHGGGCGLYGAQGNFEGAVNILRNKASERGADYVQIINKKGEHMAGLCLDRAYIVDGFAFKKSLNRQQ